MNDPTLLFPHIRAEVEEALEDARKIRVRGFPVEPIDWAGLDCVEVGYYIDEQGDGIYRVELSGARGAHELQDAIRNRLLVAGYAVWVATD